MLKDKTPREQALALDKNISVTAGAGAGKTSILVERYLKIVLQDPKLVRGTLAVTFTKKAAGEMLERVAGEVDRRLQQETDEKSRHNLLQVRDQLNSSAISTIHGFCARILREFPLEAGLAPDFNEIDEMQQIVVLDQAVKKGFGQLNQQTDGEEVDRWLWLFSRLGRKAVETMLKRALSSPYEMEQIIPRFEQFTPESYIQFLNEQRLLALTQMIAPDFLHHVYELIQHILETDDNPVSKNEAGQQALEILHDFKKTFETYGKLPPVYAPLFRLIKMFTSKDNKALASARNLGSSKSWNKDCEQLIAQLSQLLSPLAQFLKNHDAREVAGDVDLQWLVLFKQFIELYKNVRDIYQQIKNEMSAADFEDLQLMTARLLTSNEYARRQLAERFQIIMVDEFQDTNELQWQIISMLAKAEQDGKLDRRKIFVVGDPKQSIYGFRDADIRTFKNVKTIFTRLAGAKSETEYEGNIIFTESYRFLPRLNAFINYVFSETLKEREGNPFEVGYHALEAMRNVPGGGWIELALLEGPGNEKPQEAEYIAGKISELIAEKKTCFHHRDGKEIEQPIRYGDIAILLRSRGHLLEIEQELRKRDIPFKTAGGIGFWQRQEVFDFFHLLRFLDDSSDDFALIGVLRSRLFAISDSALFMLAQDEGNSYLQKLNALLKASSQNDEERADLCRTASLLNKWLACRERMMLADLLEMIMTDLQLRALLASELNGEQILANVDKLIEQAQLFDSGAAGGLHEFLARIDDLIEREMREGEAQINLEDDTTVKIMTIHAAKGLQFPVVFVPFLNTRSAAKPESIFMDADLGMAVKLKGQLKPKNKDGLVISMQLDWENQSSAINQPKEQERHLLFELLKYRQYQKETAEAKRLFYVAATRASNYLFLSAELSRETVQPVSPLGWLLSAFARDNYDLLQATQNIVREDFTLSICRELKETEISEEDAVHFFSGISGLRQIVRQYKAAPLHAPTSLTTTASRHSAFSIQHSAFRSQSSAPATATATDSATVPVPAPATATVPSPLLPLRDSPRSITFSATRLMTYLKDADEYYRRYHLGFFEGDYEAFAKDVYGTDASLLKGKLAHRFLELIPQNAQSEDELLEQILFEFDIFDSELQQEIKDELLHLKNKALQSAIGKKIILAAEAQNEVSVTMRLGSDYLTGALDRLYRNEQGFWEVADYKTNRIKPEQVEAEAAKYDWQIKSYALLLSRLFPGQDVYPVSLYFLTPDVLFQKIFLKEDIEEIAAAFIKIMEEIKVAMPVELD